MSSIFECAAHEMACLSHCASPTPVHHARPEGEARRHAGGHGSRDEDALNSIIRLSSLLHLGLGRDYDTLFRPGCNDRCSHSLPDNDQRDIFPPL